MCHLQVWRIALFYLVEDLAKVARLKVRELLDSDISNETFFAIMNQSVPEAVKSDFERVLAEACVPRLEWPRHSKPESLFLSALKNNKREERSKSS